MPGGWHVIGCPATMESVNPDDPMIAAPRWKRERDEAWRLLEMVDSHYSGSLDHQPAYVKAIRRYLEENS